jgi:ribosomal protein S18 acetylase RimI-like enzyme
MIEIHSLTQLDSTDLKRVASGYSSNGKHVVTYSDSESHTSFDLQFVTLNQPYVKKFDDYDNETLKRYDQILNNGYSFGAYENNVLVGFIISEPREWNRSLWVFEFHVAETHRNRGIGKRLMEFVAENARRKGLRTIVCETQKTNANAIEVYRKLGFSLEGIDISYYSNNDYPDGEIAVFMKRRLC